MTVEQDLLARPGIATPTVTTIGGTCRPLPLAAEAMEAIMLVTGSLVAVVHIWEEVAV